MVAKLQRFPHRAVAARDYLRKKSKPTTVASSRAERHNAATPSGPESMTGGRHPIPRRNAYAAAPAGHVSASWLCLVHGFSVSTAKVRRVALRVQSSLWLALCFGVVADNSLYT